MRGYAANVLLICASVLILLLTAVYVVGPITEAFFRWPGLGQAADDTGKPPRPKTRRRGMRMRTRMLVAGALIAGIFLGCGAASNP